MSSTLITNIQLLVNVCDGKEKLRGEQLSILPSISNAYVQIEDDVISGFGEMNGLSPALLKQSRIDAAGQIVMPAWCDSHTHLVFAGSREGEFTDKIRGLSYSEIAAKGGGILNSARKLHQISEDQLFISAWKRLEEVSGLGTGAIEIKSGYGLSVEDELKMLRVIKKLKEKSKLIIKSTFLGAHTYPLEYKSDHSAYIRLLTEEMLPVIAAEKLADYIDVFCEDGFFSPEEMETVVRAGKKFGLKPKLHVNQLNSIGGISSGIALDAVSLDHLETMPDADINKIKDASGSGWQGICTLLPAAAFFLQLPFPPARKLLHAGAAIALASDFNPGSCPSGNMNLVISMACIAMKLLPEEAINAATINGAHAMEVATMAGSIATGKKANLIFLKPMPSLSYFPYAFGSDLIDKVMIAGE
jgi:imidazolonepropionase